MVSGLGLSFSEVSSPASVGMVGGGGGPHAVLLSVPVLLLHGWEKIEERETRMGRIKLYWGTLTSIVV